MSDIDEPLAIIGMNCLLPGINADIEEVEAFFAMLLKGQSFLKETPQNRWEVDAYYDADRKKADKLITRKGGFLNNPQLFDASFFKISTVEAKQMDPQHRLFLEVAVRALNHANIPLHSLNDSLTGVFYGTSSQDYSQLNYKDQIQFNAYTQIGAANSAAAGRLSHFLNLKGPSLAVDTACSSSLAALYLAANSLRMKQASMAIVGGVQLNLCPENFIGFTKANMLSAQDQCRSFDKDADGFVSSEGCGVLIVKRLSDALRDKNSIHAVIKSIVMKQDGNDSTNLLAPNIKAQIAMHQEVLAQAHLVPADIDYIETHGSGTILGDAVEFNAIQQIHQGHHTQESPLIIGAVKSNLGHTLSASGIISLIKAIGSLNHEKIPPNLHFNQPNNQIDPGSIPAVFPVQPLEFKRKNKQRLVQISNFGFSGTSVSIIIEEPVPLSLISPTVDKAQNYAFVVSAHSMHSLTQMLASYVAYLRDTSASLQDICLTLINCRDHFKYRCAIRCTDKKTLIKLIESLDYKCQKVSVKKETKKSKIFDAAWIEETYLAGFNLDLNLSFNRVDLPLYHFDRKSYWHEVRKKASQVMPSPIPHEEQIEQIKEKLIILSQTLLKKELISEYQDLGSLGFNKELLTELEQNIATMFSLKTSISDFFTLDQLARHLQNMLMPEPVSRQPTINLLQHEAIAIIGMGCRFPKAENIHAFLSLLERGESGMSDIPPDRWDNEKYYDADVNALGRLYIKQLGLIDNIKNFDADFFNISPREAKLMAPQLRVFLETSYHALEDANLSLDAVKDSKTGVFVGCGTNEYPELLGMLGVNLEDLNIYFATGNVLNAVSGRVAYTFDFHGPIQAIDTACSSSMTAIHDACLSLQNGDCDMALAGGVNILLVPSSNVTLSKAKMLSPDSRCKTFSEDADGYARSEGCGVIVLKRLSTAIKDKDNIVALIKATSINSDGKSGGFTVPNGVAQEELIRNALAKAQLSPQDIDYIEAHGTGTPLADPIEANTVSKIFSEAHSADKPLYLSSVKTNIGHCESASGISGVIKAVLSLQTQQLFKHLNFKKLNPQIEFKNMVIPSRTTKWSKEAGLRCAGVSSFGFSGANAHLILQEMPAKKIALRSLPQESLLIISAKSRQTLESLLRSYQHYLANTKEEFADICYTAALCRTHFFFRVAIKAATASEAALMLKNNEYAIYQIKKENNDQRLSHFSKSLTQLQTDFQDGIKINWTDFYQGLDIPFLKVKLPLYEFAPDEHWFETEDKLKEVTPLPKDCCFQLKWQQQLCTRNNHKSQGNNWLLIGRPQLASKLRGQGLEISLEGEYQSLEHFAGIIFAAALDVPEKIDIESSIEFQKNSIKKLLALVKELHQKDFNPQLIVLTSNAIAELAVGELNLSASSLVGFCRTLVLELPQLNTILIDSEKIEDENYAGYIVDEIKHNFASCYEHVVAYRENKRFISRLQKVKLIDKKRSLVAAGRYLITGGCGGLGLISAQALLSSGAREVILISRTVDTLAIKQAIKKIQANYVGRTVRALSLDITDKEKLGHLLAELNADGLLKGIIHTAGTVIKAPLLAHEEADVDYLFPAKVQGAWYLHELSQNINLDFFVVYSSIASVFGSNKESVYSGANSFLDALIAQRQRLGLVGTSIEWGSWGEVGMATKRAQNQGLKNALLSNEQGYTFIKILLNEQFSHVAIISPEYLKFMLDFVPNPVPVLHQQLALDLGSTDPVVDHNLSPWLNDYQEIRKADQFTVCKEMISSVCKEILELSHAEEFDEDEGFFELGFDSLMITEMATRLKGKLAPILKVTATIGFDYPTINKLAKHIESELTKHLKAQSRSKPEQQPVEDAIAIIGMSCNFPNASDVFAFENLLEEGLNGIRDIPMERWDNREYYDSDKNAPGKSYVNKLGLIDNIKDFDANFFGISPREAKLIEPQQRLFLECSYKAIENANYLPETLKGSMTGVFAGVGPNEYYAQLEKAGFSNEELSVYSITGNVSNLIPGRVAYTFDLRGPSISVDTACSSSLVAIHYACQSLKNKEVDYALAGGVNVLLLPEANITLCKARALSAEGQCKTFDERADGYARAEGCGVLLLKRLSDALRDKDTVLAVIKASAVNNDGKSAGLTVPNGKSQEAVMLKALSQTDLSSADISYVEAHGTGTPLGDPIEVHAINQVYGKGHSADNPLYLGAVKTNIGHLESAAGVASVIKTVISLQKQKIYKLLHFNKLNPHIDLGETHLALKNMDWPSRAKLRTAGINAFGFSGTNAHLIIQEFPKSEPQPIKVSAPQFLVLSAHSSMALSHLAQKYQHYLATTKDDFADICFTAATCRTHFANRLALVAQNAPEAARLLEAKQYVCANDTNNNLNPVLTDYLQGKTIDWRLYYKNKDPELQRVKLPAYIFDSIEFWLAKKNIMPKTASAPSLYEDVYQPQWLPFKLDAFLTSTKPEFWVISREPEKAQRLFANLKYQLIASIDDLESIEDKNIVFLYHQTQFYELFHCCQKLFKSVPHSFLLITENAYAITDTERVNPYHTMACSFWKTFSNELDLIQNYAVDLDSNSSLSERLIEYLFHTNSQNQFVVRDGIYIPRLNKIELRVDLQHERGLKSEATYLITGGTGALATLLIEYLIRRGAQHILITSRTECSMPIKELIEDARKKNVVIKHHQADASNYQQMEAIIAEIGQSEYPLQGVFHLAGMLQDGLLVHLKDEEMHSVLSAKMDSALILHQLTQKIPLDLFVLFSSVASLLGAKGQANYVAANGFLDGLAHLRKQQGLASLVINWGPFQAMGMTHNLSEALQKRGFNLLDKYSMDLLDVLLQGTLTQVAICSINWDIYFKYSSKKPWLATLGKEPQAQSQDLLNSLQEFSKEDRQLKLSHILRELVADVLDLNNAAQIKMNEGLFSLGLDSLMAIEIRNRIHDKLQCANLSLSIEYFINEPNINKMAEHIENQLQQVFKLTQANQKRLPVLAEKVPLCDFQYVFWVLNKLHYPYNIGTQLQIQGKLNKDFIAQALDAVVQHNKAFWLCFDNDLPIQKVKQKGRFKLIDVDVSLNGEGQMLYQEFQNNMLEEIPLNAPPLIKAYLYKINSDLHELHLIIPHIIVDGPSCDLVLSQFIKFYEALAQGKPLSVEPEKDSFLNFVEKNNTVYADDLKNKIKFWQQYNKGFENLYLGPEFFMPAEYQQQYLVHYPVEPSQAIQFIEWHKAKNRNVSSGLIAACHLVLYKLSKQKKIPFIQIHSGREGSQFNSIVGLFSEYKRLNIALEDNFTFMDLIKVIEEEQLKTAAFQKCSHVIKNNEFKDAGLTLSHYFFYRWNKFWLGTKFKNSKLNALLVDYYLKYLSWGEVLIFSESVKSKLYKLLHWSLPRQQPERLRILVNITPSFYNKVVPEMRVNQLKFEYMNHFGSEDRPLNNRTLWILFSRNQDGEFLISINGPVTNECKDLIAWEFNQLISKLLENDESVVTDLL